jgi:hypothetical protein
MKILVIMILFSLATCLLACQQNPHNKNMKVTSIKSSIDKDSPDYAICSSFALTKEEVITYFSIAEEVDGNEFNQEAIILPCKYEGSINIDAEQFYWEISAGGAGYLYRDKEVSKRYLCKESCCEMLKNLC